MRLARGLFASCFVMVAACGGGGDNPPGGDDDPASPDASDDPPANGFRIESPPLTIEPGEEVTYCYYTTIDVDTEVGVKRWSSRMTAGSHHLIVYFTDQAGAPDGTLTEDCDTISGNLPVWTYSAGTPEYENVMPEGVGMLVKPQQKLFVQMH